MARWIVICVLAASLGILSARPALGAEQTSPGNSAGAGVKVKLTSVPLAAPGMILTSHDGAKATVLLGMIRPAKPLSFRHGQTEGQIEIGSTQVTVVFDGKDCQVKTDQFSATIQARRGAAAPGAAPISIPLGNGKSYTLAFPDYVVIPQIADAAVWYRSGFAMRGQSAGLTFTLYDDELDGQFTLGRAAVAVSVGDSPVMVFAPPSRHMVTGRGIIDVTSVAEDGRELTYNKYVGPVGMVQMSGPRDVDLYAAFKSEDADAAFVTEIGPRSWSRVSAPPGNYQLQYGVAYAAGQRRVLAVMTPGDLPSVNVQEGPATKLALGGPYHFDVTAQYENGKVRIEPASMHLRGANGEEYRDYSCDLNFPPEVFLSVGRLQVPLERMRFA